MAKKKVSKSPEAAVDYSKDPINAKLTPSEKVDLLRQMVRIRRFETVSLKYYQQGKMGGFLHLYIGQESVAVGTISLLGEHDHVITAYRDHGHALAVGMSMNECMAELFGKKTGCSKGKGGSMHYFAPDKNYWGGHGIVAGQTPLGAGLAFALKYKGLTGCCLCYLGDGAVNQGAYHEALNLAELWDLPVIYVIENNGYSMGTSQERSSAHSHKGLAARAEAYGMEWDQINGEDLYEVRARTQKAIDRAHHESRPTVLEIDTYRYKGHSVADANAEKYRTKEEIQRYMNEHDPLTCWKDQLIAEGIVSEEDFKNLMKEAGDEAEAAAQFAQQSPYPDESEMLDDIYWEVDNQTEAGRTGRHFFH
ncbi:MAG: pyruvate dehydrogenase (acetyl-transferring) E1 component subunit alpha [Verrucomicrobiales bacterium]|nr:pyruvate dehydrogenase (acetyl-transferring) E1 component subunit alpha [Verrucomicrobiales bacterium]